MQQIYQETTCSARVVDGMVRGGAAGALWGLFLSSNARFSGGAAGRRRAVTRAVVRYAGTGSVFLGIYSGVFCVMSSKRANGRAVASGAAGAAAGTFIAARSAASPRNTVLTAAVCGGVSVLVGALDRRGVEGRNR